MKLCAAYPLMPEKRGSFINNHLVFLKPELELYFHQYPIYANGKLIFKFPTSLWIVRTTLKNIFPKLYHYIHKNRIAKILKENNINIVLAEYGLVGAALYQACQKANIPLVVHFHGYDAYKYNVLEELSESYKKMFEAASTIIGVSDDMVEQLISLGADRKKVTKITYGVDIDNFSTTEASDNPPEFIAVGNFTPKKAPQLTIKAFHLVTKEFPEARLKMIGDGELWEECKILAKKLDISDKIDFLGRQNFDQISNYMQKARVFVQHSIRPDTGDSEGSPNAILEASSCALPIVSTKHAGIIETVIHGETGFLVDEKDVESMAFYMKKFIANPEIASQMGKKGRQHISKNYTLTSQLNKLKNELQAHSK